MLKKYGLLLLTALYFAAAAAQDIQSVEKQIRHLEKAVVQAILRSDTNELKLLWAPEFLVNTPRNTIADGRTAVLEIQKAGLINYASFERTIEEVLIRGNVAITMGSESYAPSGNGNSIAPIRRRFTNIWMKEGTHWRQVARHASVICP